MGELSQHSSSIQGQTVAHYRVLAKLGSGGMGEVYEGEDIRLGRHVALKVLPENLMRDATALQRFEREARAASSLNHPGICTIYEVEEYERQPVIVMELLQGETLKERIRERPASTEEVLDFGIQLSDALGAAHARGIIHRDLKPGNVFVVEQARLKILDFGLAKVVSSSVAEVPDDDSLTLEGAIPGTTPYMSPEQARGEDLDARSDLFSLGVVLFELATRQRPFTRKNRILTIDAILNSRPPDPSALNPALPQQLDAVLRKALEKDREHRYQSAAELSADLQSIRHGITSATLPSAVTSKQEAHRVFVWLLSAAFVICVLLLGTTYRFLHRVSKLTEKDTILLADFTNSTGEPIFDETLRQGMAVQLEQSPYLSLVSDERVQQTLGLMGKPPSTKMTPELAREVCQRSAGAAVLEGSIAELGSKYVLGLRARNCQTGEVFDQEQAQASRKEDVLDSLTRMASAFRRRTGESLSTLRQYDIPLEQATTPSLEALKAFSSSRRAAFGEGFDTAIPLLKRAVELDPNFAMAYADLGLDYASTGESVLATEATTKAYQLQDHANDHEKFFIRAIYDRHVTGNLERAHETLQLWARTYPRDRDAHGLLSGFSSQGTGRYEESIREGRKATEIDPDFAPGYINPAYSYFWLNRFDEAKQLAQQAMVRNFQMGELSALLYHIGVIQSDQEEEQQAIALAAGKPGSEDWITHSQALASARSGQLRKARSFSARAFELAREAGQQERAASYESGEAVYEALLGNATAAREHSRAALALSTGRDVEYGAAFALALANDNTRAHQLASDLARRFPEDSSVEFAYLPALRAMFSLSQNHPQKAVQELEGAQAHELSVPAIDFNFFFGGLYSAYVRGLAYLAMHKGGEAVAEFQNIIGHPGLTFADPVSSLAYLQCARAYAIAGNKSKSKAAYETFLVLWKDADADLPLFRLARSEYGRLQ